MRNRFHNGRPIGICRIEPPLSTLVKTGYVAQIGHLHFHRTGRAPGELFAEKHDGTVSIFSTRGHPDHPRPCPAFA